MTVTETLERMASLPKPPSGPAPHVAKRMEPGAILYSSWGYDQTNIDFYMVTRTTKSSAWIVPMSSRIVEQVGWLSEHVEAGAPLSHTGFCECRHSVHNHGDYRCRGMYGEDCECETLRPIAIKPAMHRIRRWSHGEETHETLTLTSYSSASLWGGRELYASHYA